MGVAREEEEEAVGRGASPQRKGLLFWEVRTVGVVDAAREEESEATHKRDQRGRVLWAWGFAVGGNGDVLTNGWN